MAPSSAATLGVWLGIDNNGIDIRPASPVNTAAATVVYDNVGSANGSDPFETSVFEISNDRAGYELELRYELANGNPVTISIPHGESATLTYTVGNAAFARKGLFLSATPPHEAPRARQRVRAKNGYAPDLAKIAPSTRRRRHSGKLELVINIHGFETVLEFAFQVSEQDH